MSIFHALRHRLRALFHPGACQREPRASARCCWCFSGGVALALATLGTYGVVSFAVAQRTREIGIRIALGATRGNVTRMVVGKGIGIAVVGGVAGLIAALAATRVLRSLLYNVAPSDPVTFIGMAMLLVLAVTAASWIPARRATGIQPTEALRDG